MAINKIFKNYGESEEDGDPIDAEFLNSIVSAVNSAESKVGALENKTQHITADTAGTHFESGVYANGNELVADDDYPDPSDVQVNNIESEENS